MSFILNSATYNMIRQYYIGSGVWFFLTILSLIYIVCTTNKSARKKILLIFVLSIIVILNDISYSFLISIFAAASYYRFLWVLPYPLVVACAFIKFALRTIKNTEYDRYMNTFVVICMSVLLFSFVYSTGSVYLYNLKNDRPTNEYLVDQDVYELKSIMDSMREDGQIEGLVTLAAPSVFVLQYQTIDAGTIMAVDRYTVLDIRSGSVDLNLVPMEDIYKYRLMKICEDGEHIDPSEAREAIDGLAVEYIIVNRGYKMSDYVKALGTVYVDSTSYYDIYRIEN